MSSPHSPAPRRAAGVLLMSQDAPKFLLLRHADRWDLPKGHADGTESFVETALRETEEETGLSPSMIRLDPDFRFELAYRVSYDGDSASAFDKHVVYFLGYVPATFEPTLTEHQGFEWFDWSPPHQIQSQTVDPLLAAVANHLSDQGTSASAGA